MPIKDPIKRREYARVWMAKRRAAHFHGKACAICGSTNRLELDHIDPAQKTHHCIWSWSDVRRNAELAKCQILCHACHRAKTFVQSAPPAVHGTRTRAIRKKCACPKCQSFRESYNAHRRERRRLCR